MQENSSVFINGWTKASTLTHIRANFKGKSLLVPNGPCTYRGPEGKKCAVGMFIPHEYDADIVQNKCNTESAFVLFNRIPHLLKKMPLDIGLLTMLQMAHDQSRTDEDCLANMLRYVESLT